MPVPAEGCQSSASACLVPPAPINTQQPGVATSLLYSGSQFRGYQKSKGNAYDVEVVVQVKLQFGWLASWLSLTAPIDPTRQETSRQPAQAAVTVSL